MEGDPAFDCAEGRINRPRLAYIPTEIKDSVLQYTDRNTLLSAVRCSKALHQIGSRLLYRSITVTGIQARKLFIAVISLTWTSNICTSFIRELSFTGIHYNDIWLSFSLFTEALEKMHNLVGLTVVIGQSPGAQHLIGYLTTHELIRPFATIFQQLAFNLRKSSRLTLPKLRSLTIQGDPVLTRLTRCRRLTSLILVERMQLPDLCEVFRNVDYGGTGAGTYIVNFEVNLDIQRPSDVITTFVALSKTSPNLASFCIRVNQINPLVCLLYLSKCIMVAKHHF